MNFQTSFSVRVFFTLVAISPLWAFSPIPIRPKALFSPNHAGIHTAPSPAFMTSVVIDADSVEDDEEESPPQVLEISDLAHEQIVEMIEVSFINACVQLAQGYVDVLKLFIVSVKAAFEMDTPSSKLAADLAVCPVNTAGRELSPEEVELRTTWIQAVYLILEHIGHQGKDEMRDIDESVRKTYAGIIPHVVALKNEEGTFQTDEFVAKHSDLLPVFESPMDTAIVSQTVRVLWYALTVLEEEALSEETAASPPRPPIPGAYKGFDKN